MTQSTVESLLAVRSLIEKGWTQGEMRKPGYDKDSCFCLFGAVASVCGIGTSQSEPEGALRNILYRECGRKSLVDFNDAPDRTVEEVLALIDRTIEAETQP